MSDVRIDWDESFFQNLLKTPEVAGLCEQAAAAAAAAARATAPVKTGVYRDSIHVEQKQGKTRAWCKVVADDEKAGLIESKTGNMRRSLSKARI